MTVDEFNTQGKDLIAKYVADNHRAVCMLYNALMDIPKPDTEPKPEPTQLELFE